MVHVFFDKYMVVDKKAIMGNEINFSPRHISSINSESESCVVAGKINFLTEKTYTSKSATNFSVFSI